MFKVSEIVQEKDQSILTITRNIGIIIQIRKQIDIPLSKVIKDDIKKIFQKIAIIPIKKYQKMIIMIRITNKQLKILL